MEFVEAEGQTIDDAIERALQLLGVSRDKADIEIVANAARGLFGFGGRRAKVRATLRRPMTFAAGSDSEAASTPAATSRRAPAESSATPAARPHHAPSPPRVPEAPRRAAEPPRREPPRRPAETRHKASERRRGAPERSGPAPEPSPRAPHPDVPSIPLSDAAVEHARTVLAEIVRLSGSEASVEVTREPESVRLVITGDPSGLLIGRRGQTLDALEYVLHRIMPQEDEGSGRLVVDTESYRLRRQQSLEELARHVAERARRSGKPLSLSPMSPRDRRIVHLALQDDPTLTTRSAGTGFFRKVVIVPAGARRGGRSRQPEPT